MKKYVRVLLISFIMLIALGIFNQSVKAADSFPKEIKASYSDLMSQSGIRLFKKSASFDGNTVKAFCGSFLDKQPSGTCKRLTSWRVSDEDKAKYIGYAIGAMIYKGRTIDKLDWKGTYFYGEMAMNVLLVEWGSLNKNKLYTTKELLNNATYKQMYNAGSAEYTRAKGLLEAKTNMNVVSTTVKKNGQYTIKIKCGKNGKKSTDKCSVYKFTPTVKATNKAGNLLAVETKPKVSYDANMATITGKFKTDNLDKTNGDKISLKTSIKATGNTSKYSGKYDLFKAALYDCGNGYQPLIINQLVGVQLSKTLEGSAIKEIPEKVEDQEEYELKILKAEVEQNKVKTYLDKAEINIYKVDSIGEASSFNCSNPNSSKLIAKNVEIKQGDISFEGKIGENNIIENDVYVVCEKVAPEGYEIDQDGKYSIQITKNNEVDGVYVNQLLIHNKPKSSSLTIKKVDQDGNLVAGAKLKVCETVITDVSAEDYETENSEAGEDNAEDVEETIGEDQSGSLEEFSDLKCMKFGENDYFITDGSNNQTISNLELGKIYTVIEESAPEGYSIAPSQSIELQEDENVVTMTNIYSSFKISKVDITSKKELPGALLEIRDARGVELYSWTSTNKPQEIIGLSDGEYTLVEKTAPKGYTVAESMNFKIENGKLVAGDNVSDNTLIMKDSVVVDVPDTFSSKNIITMMIGLVMVALGTGVLIYEFKQKKTA